MSSDNFSGDTTRGPSTESSQSSSPASGSSKATGANLGNTASALKSKAAELGQSANAKMDSGRSAAAGGIASAAATLHERADQLPGGEKVTTFAHSAADKLSSTADYIRDHDMNAMVDDIKTLVKNNPGPALLGAVALGFLLGKAFSD